LRLTSFNKKGDEYLEELELIYKAKQGNKSALNTLLTNNYSLLKGYIIKMTGNPELAQDIVQETMLKSVLNINKFIPQAKFSTWLIKIATNLYKDYLRKNKTLEIMDELIEDKAVNPEMEALINIEFKETMEILLSFPYEKRTVFILKHYYGYKYEEIAQILDCPLGTVRSRLHNTVKQLIFELERKELGK
jgi:RNA polymerase sigma-70 factor, ECF subfamily